MVCERGGVVGESMRREREGGLDKKIVLLSYIGSKRFDGGEGEAFMRAAILRLAASILQGPRRP